MQLYLECHYEAHASLIESITENSCRQLCQTLTPHVPNFFFWVGERLSIRYENILKIEKPRRSRGSARLLILGR